MHVNRPLYRVRCHDCGWEQERLEHIESAQMARSCHHADARGHRIRISFDLYDVVIDETTGTSEELDRR